MLDFHLACTNKKNSIVHVCFRGIILKCAHLKAKQQDTRTHTHTWINTHKHKAVIIEGKIWPYYSVLNLYVDTGLQRFCCGVKV